LPSRGDYLVTTCFKNSVRLSPASDLAELMMRTNVGSRVRIAPIRQRRYSSLLISHFAAFSARISAIRLAILSLYYQPCSIAIDVLLAISSLPVSFGVSDH
jgi:hypothetical protein